MLMVLSWHTDNPRLPNINAALCQMFISLPSFKTTSSFNCGASYPGFGGIMDGGNKPVSAEKPSELGTGEGAGESLELTLCPSEPEHSFTNFTLKSM